MATKSRFLETLKNEGIPKSRVHQMPSKVTILVPKDKMELAEVVGKLNVPEGCSVAVGELPWWRGWFKKHAFIEKLS